MSLDAARTAPRPGRPTDQEVRERLDHARATLLIQLRALGDTGRIADDHLTATQKAAIAGVLKEIDDAFARVEDGTYGTCLGCAESVPAERLEILPYTGHCVACRRRAA